MSKMSSAYQKNFLAMMGYKNIRAFQEKNNLAETGKWNKKTDAKAKTITKGIQSRLNYWGAGLGTPDGVPGPNTKKKIIWFKENLGYPATILIDAKTRKALFTDQGEKISKHFRKSEFKCHCKGKWCDGYNGVAVNKDLIEILEKIREETGKPITITSGIRCQKYNDSLRGSAKNSVHRLGGAADIYIPGITTNSAGKQRIIKLAYKYGAKYAYTNNSNMGTAVHINV